MFTSKSGATWTTKREAMIDDVLFGLDMCDRHNITTPAACIIVRADSELAEITISRWSAVSGEEHIHRTFSDFYAADAAAEAVELALEDSAEVRA